MHVSAENLNINQPQLCDVLNGMEIICNYRIYVQMLVTLQDHITIPARTQS